MAGKKNSEFLSAFGASFEIWRALTNEVLALNGNDDHIRRIKTDAKLRRKIAELIVGVGETAQAVADNVYRIVVNPDLTVEDMIAEGGYDWRNGVITSKNFPMTDEDRARAGQETDAELILIDRHISYDDALLKLDRRGYRPASIFELLAFGAKFPQMQLQFPIVALGSVWHGRGGRDVACLSWDGAKRGLYLNDLDLRWGAHCRFLAVRK